MAASDGLREAEPPLIDQWCTGCGAQMHEGEPLHKRYDPGHSDYREPARAPHDAPALDRERPDTDDALALLDELRARFDQGHMLSWQDLLLAALGDVRLPETGLRAAAEALQAALDAALAAEFLDGRDWTKAPGRRWLPAEALDSLPGILGLPCPYRSSLTDVPCVLAWGHPSDSPSRFHRFTAAALSVPATGPEGLLKVAEAEHCRSDG